MKAAVVKTVQELQAEIEELHAQLFEATETIEAIRTGEIDALIVQNKNGPQLYTLKTADVAYRVFIERMTEGAVTLNAEGIILYCNTRFASMVALPLSDVIGTKLENFITVEAGPSFAETFKQAWTQDCKSGVSLTTSHKNIPVQLSLNAIQLEGAAVLCILLTDLSAQKKTQQQLEENNVELAHINHALEISNHDLQQFASVASHDLQEPLRKVQLYSNLLKDRANDQLSTELKSYLDKIIVSARRMKELIIDVLSYSKLSATNTVQNEVDLGALVKDLVDDFELMVQEKKAIITIGSLPSIAVNRGQIRQVFQNLISNALKFSKDSGTPVISISSKQIKEKAFNSEEDREGKFYLINIADNGIGFDEKYAAQIFALFERLHTKGNYEGTGIGLAITKKIIEKHNGIITARSRDGEGSSFCFILPAQQ